MSARVLVTDDNPLNVKLLAAKLTREYYTVLTAENGRQALEKTQSEKPDLVLLDVMMPELDGFETCKQLKTNPLTQNIPVVMVTALSDVKDRIRGLEAGADDFLTKPINDIALFARVRSCLRLKATMDEWRMREGQAALHSADLAREGLQQANIALIDNNPHEQDIIKKRLSHIGMQAHAFDTLEALSGFCKTNVADAVLVSLAMMGDDGLRIVAALKAQESTRQIPLVVYSDEGDVSRIAKALDIGASDYIFKPVDAMELQARLSTQVRYKRAYDRLKMSYEKNMVMAMTDPLTGAHNRHYLEQNMPRLFERCRRDKKAISVVMVDIDHFKKINDTYGHHVGDQVLQEVARRLNSTMRFFDLVVRMGGEEFALIMPETPYDNAMLAAERLRRMVAEKPFEVMAPVGPLTITMSVGVASSNEGDMESQQLFEAADAALYKAKNEGRNCVVGEI